MPKPSYTVKSVEQAHRWIAKSFDALAEAHALIRAGEPAWVRTIVSTTAPTILPLLCSGSL